ncbi:GAF domain-containing protein [Amnibacterium sp.]|uniref:GAF domain-containing protein n=1 Tax=Amnibacterium sp. TaxID=1872496 RepID=UPI002636AF24|nr:GAF domain-containing protein [Amnibacterium sp.]MCU1473554.1 diguanylate cyclase [Amnibacterium sp.]
MSIPTFRLPETTPALAPDRVAAVRRSGWQPHRVLMLGGGVLRGLGLRSHNLGLPGHVADQLSARTGRGVDLDVIVEDDPTAARALEGVRGLRLRRYDAIVVFLDAEAARSCGRPDRWRRRIEQLCNTLQDECATEATIVIYDAPCEDTGMLGLPSRRVRTTIDKMAAEVAAVSFLFGVTFDSLPSAGTRMTMGIVPSATTYAIWADAIVNRLHPRLRALEARSTPDTPRAFRNRPDPERPRMRALAQMRLRPNHRDSLLDYIVTQAKVTFRADAAHLNIIDGDLQWAQASTDAEAAEVSREFAFCNQTIQADGLTLVNDAQRDPRFRGNPLTEGPDPIRFYAGYPIHTWDGYRIGALCIIGSTPRSMLESELLPLQDFAGRVEQELWATALRERPALQPS